MISMMHRYLRNRLSNYDYQKYFSGIIYLCYVGYDAKNPSYIIIIYYSKLCSY